MLLPIAASRVVIASIVLLSVELKVSAICQLTPYYRNVTQSSCNSLEDLVLDQQLAKHVQIHLVNNSEFREFPSKVSENVKDIETLEIYRSIKKLRGGAFAKFTKIQRISLSYNEIEVIEEGTFKNLNATRISLMDNKIKVILSGAFVNLTNLVALRVSNNNLTKISNGIYNKLPVETLSLANNQISTIEKAALSEMSKLTKLSLNDNNINSFVKQEICPDSNLKWLWLYNNKLKTITSYMLEGLKELKVLNLAFNEILMIEPNSFEQTPSLELLSLSHNLIKIIDGSTLPLTGLNKLKSLYLDHNRLTFLSSGFLFRLSALHSMTIGGNPWQCPCLDFILNWVFDNKVILKCDSDFLNGKRPICVVPKDNNICLYYYDEAHFQQFNRIYQNYPSNISYSFCIL